MSAYQYFAVFIFSVAAIAAIYSSRYISSGTNLKTEEGDRNIIFPIFVCIVLALWMGNRPLHYVFGDTVNYAHGYISTGESNFHIKFGEEWAFYGLNIICYRLNLDVHDFFTLVDFIYIFTMLWALKILMPKNLMLSLLFALGSFSFFTFGVNGIRNGMSVHIALLAMALYLEDKKVFAAVMALLAFSVHKSVALPLAAFLAGVYVLKKPQYAIMIWIASIVMSFFAGGAVTAFFAGLGFDDRMTTYLTTDVNFLDNTTSAFRWDFLLYSSMPVLMFWFVTMKQKCSDNWYNVLGITYCLTNSFWVLVIRAAFSNRFAFLSWFLYPVVIAYPLIMLNVWDKDQDKQTGIILLGYILLTIGIAYFTNMI